MNSKKDGVYTIRSILYRVENGRATHVATEGIVLELCGAFNVRVGQYTNRYDGRELLKRI